MREASLDQVEVRFDEEMEEIEDGRGRLAEGVRSLAVAAPYAAFGIVTAGARRGTGLIGSAAAVPGRLARLTTGAPRRVAAGLRRMPERVVAAFRDSERAGRSAVDRILGRESLAQARRQMRSARSKAKSATTSARRAARASADAVAAAAEAAVDPRDTRPYEERTREELYALACERDVSGRSGMKKKQLIQALRRDR
jgi:hypothetical protein